MKTVLFAKHLKGIVLETTSCLDRENIAVLMAATNDEILKICRTEVIDLLITQLEMPGKRSEELFKIIRNSKELQDVSTIIICSDTLANRERCRQCSPNAVVTMPVDAASFT